MKQTENGRTQKELARELADELGLTEHKAMRFIRRLLQCVADDLVEKGHVELRGLGTFEAVRRPPQTIKHPVTGKEIKVPSYRTIRFRASKGLRERLMPDPPPKKGKRRP